MKKIVVDRELIKDKIRKYFIIKVGKLFGPTVPLKTGQPPTAGTIMVRK
jgi:hypothetical protein